MCCISSILETGFPENQIIIVDNASTDGSVEEVHKSFGPRINLIRNKDNLGFAEGNNIGVSQAKELGARWYFLLNNDTIVSQKVFEEFSHVIINFPDISIFSPMILQYHHPNMIWNAGNRLIPGTLLSYQVLTGRLNNRQFQNIIIVDFITGCGMLIKAEVVDCIGLFNPDLFMYGEDVDFCWRAKQAGYKIACATKARIWHKISGGGGGDSYKSRFLRVRNQIYFYKKYSNIIQKPIMLIFTLAQLIVRGAHDLVSRKPELIKASIRGFLEGWF
jgi:GT2 family glycosyltransferase